MTTSNIIIPLEFWFCKQSESALHDNNTSRGNKYNEIENKINKDLDNLDSMNYEEVIKLEKEVSEYISKITRISGYYSGTSDIFSHFTDPICERKKMLLLESNLYAKRFYDAKLVITKSENVNGYKLYYTDQNIMDFEEFEELRQLYKKNENIPKEEFDEWFKDNACTDWCKMDRHGECFGGFWKFPEGTTEKKNAYTLSRKDNCGGLWELPYAKKLIQKTVEIGCGNRMESVRYSNFLCEWIKRMSEIVYL
jgi:hypothetical protein